MPALIFDLDGTLTDSKPGILGCLRKVVDSWGLRNCGPLERFIGPPVEEWAVDLLPHSTEAEHIEFARDYRSCYDREGWSNNSVFPGVREMLTELRAQGFPLYVCTSKQQHFAIRILEKFELSELFKAIYGDKLEYVDHSKPQLLARLITEQRLLVDSTYMIGDRSFDFDAAHANKLRAIAAAWGYGTLQEYAYADLLARTPAEVLSFLATADKTDCRR